MTHQTYELIAVVHFCGKNNIGGQSLIFNLQESGEFVYEGTFGGYVIETGLFVNNAGAMTEVTIRMKKSI